LVKSSRAIKLFNEIIEQNEPAKYYNKREIVNLLRSAHINGENEMIRKKHIENINRNFNF
jgi:hypothetical protein